MKKMIVLVVACAAVVTSYGYGVKGMRRGVRKSTYSTSTSSYSTTKSGHGINGCGYKGCHGSLCKGGYVSHANETKKSSFNVGTALSVVRTVNQTASTINRIKTSNERVEISRDNLEVRKYNAGLDSKYGKKTECVPEVVNAKVEVANGTINDSFYRDRYEEYCEKYNSEKDKTTNLAQFYLKKMNEYGSKIGISPIVAKK